MTFVKPNYAAKAREAWGDDLLDWVLVLAEQADATSLSKVAKQISFSAPMLSQIISGNYTGRYDGAAKAVRHAYMREVVACPFLGEIASQICDRWQDKARNFAPTSSLSVAMARTCRGCAHFVPEEDSDD